ncbi:MAG: hypothetical protein ACOYK9_05505, partial [Chlamydiia bacterium]
MFKKILLSAGMISAVYGITPDAPPKENCPYLPPCYNNHPYLSVDFLYWVAKQEGNDFAATGVAITVPGTTDLNTQQIPPVITSQGKVYVPTPVGKPGFKVGAGLHLEYDEWDLFSEYSFLYSNATNSVYSNDLNAGILPIFSYTSNNSILSTTTSVVSLGARGFVTAATSKWTLQFNNIN